MKESEENIHIECLEYFKKLTSGIIIHKTSDDQSGEYEVLFINDALKRIFNFHKNPHKTLSNCEAYQWVISHLQTIGDKDYHQEEHYFESHDKYCTIETYRLANQLVISNFKDITEQTKEALDHQLSQQLSMVGHYTYYIQEDYWTGSQSLFDIFGIPSDYTCDAKGWLQVVTEEDRQDMAHYLTVHVIQNHGNFDKKYRIETMDTHEIKWVHGLGKLIFNEEGVLVKMFGTISDITEQMNIEQELRVINDTKDKLFSIISHDLKGPISHLKLMTEAFEQDIPMDVQDIKSVMDKISSNVRNTSALLENLLLWAEAQRNHIQANIHRYDLDRIIQDCITLLTPQAENKHISFDVTLDKIAAEIDHDMMTFVIRNLISNAIKFTPRGGHIKILLAYSDNKPHITIEDNGIGMSPVQLDSLFQFKSIQRTRGTEHEKGTGLGLVLCKEFVEMNNGSLIVSSNLGEGSRFIIQLH